ncbi:MAG: hypothetical protein AAF945_06710, partial [Actinomycetota bacterium]
GEISLDQVVPIVQWVPAWADEQFVTQAVKLTPRQAARLARTYPFVTPPDEADTVGNPTRLEPDPTSVGADGVSEQADGDADSIPAEPTESPASAKRPVEVGWCGVGDDRRWRLYLETDDRRAGDIIEAALDEARDRLFGPDHLTRPSSNRSSRSPRGIWIGSTNRHGGNGTGSTTTSTSPTPR